MKDDPDEVCCSPANAWTWCRELAVMALAGDDDAKRALPDAVGHYLAAILPSWASVDDEGDG